MEVIHSLGLLKLKRGTSENVGFLLANKKGSYCSFYNSPNSRYNGLFYFDEKTRDMYKFVEQIEPANKHNVSRLKNGFYFFERGNEDFIESFTMPTGFNSLMYELSGEHEIDLMLDCKKSADNREWGRYYDIFEGDRCVIVKFTKKTDSKEDSSHGIDEYSLYLAVRSDKNSFSKNDRWVERNYPSDEKRNSIPFKRYVYNALRLRGSKFVFSMSNNKNAAINECNNVFNNFDGLKAKEKGLFVRFLNNKHIKKLLNDEKISDDIKIAYVNAFNSLNNLVVDGRNSYGAFAGLPWFFQFWTRDTLVSWKSLSKISHEFAEKILFDYLNRINEDGRLSNLNGKHKSTEMGCADAHGWLFFRCTEIVSQISKNKEIINSIKKSINLIKQNKKSDSIKIKDYLRNCNSVIGKKENGYQKMLYEIESSLERSINGLLKFHTKDGFEINRKLETWMDTEVSSNERNNAAIEIQASRLRMYNLLFELTQNHKYKVLEHVLKTKVKDKFWNGKTLADGLGDFTVRPNIFLAAYIYPELLTSKEWEACFDNALQALWLDWGGLSTIDKNNSLFTEESTGENVKSYHRGDSWFWVNNLSALVLNKLNKNKFKKNIQKILEASTEEILWKGCIGCHSELSSAKELRSEGCFNQAWSNAMFIELVDEVFEN